MKTAKTILFLVFLCSITTIVSAQINVNDNINEADLVGILTNNSPCVTPSNETAKGDTFTAGKNSYGSFDKDTSNFPFAKGIVLSTWSATNAIGPYITGNQGGGDASWSGDTDLNNALKITKSVNTTSLEFDFIPLTNFISFNYIFASNEYQKNYPCNYSDAFAFLIKEDTPMASYKNLAIIPGSLTPVSSENIHPLINDYTDNGVLRKGCQAINEKYFKGFNDATSPINYSGQTVVMNAQTNVIAGNKYHIKLVIADGKDVLLDSAVFLEAGSFSPKIDLGSDQLLATNNPVCFGDTYSIKMDDILPGVSVFNYEWYEDGAILTETGSVLSVTKDGTYKVKVDLGGGCSATGEIKIEFAPEIILNPTTLNKCADTGNGTATFDLTKAKTDLLDGNPATTTIDYFKTITLSDLILDPSSFKYNLSTGNIVYANLTIYGTCSAIAEITLQTLPSTVISGICPDPIINAFSGNKNSVELIPPPTGDPYEYSLDGTKYQTLPLFTNLAAGEYTAYIRNSSTCEYLTYPITILDYPRFFTPNNDGYNDTWKIKNLDLFPKAILTIFDRYGNLLTQINTVNSEWNGKFNGYELPADDYWFTLNFGEGKVSKGHFSLKR